MRRLTILLATVAALMLVPAASAFANGTFTVTLTGTGQGEINSPDNFSSSGVDGEGNPIYIWTGTPPIECSGPPATGVCENELEETEFFEGFEVVEVIARAFPGSKFAGYTVEEGFELEPTWCGGGSVGNPAGAHPYTCPIGVETGEGNVKVTAEFECETEGGCEPPVEGPELTVAKEGTGSGTVVSNPAGIECGATCSSTAFEEGTKVTLTASPSAGSTFVSWKGCEKGGVNGRQCTVTMDKAKTVNAKFLTAYDVTVNRVGSGLGKVSSFPGRSPLPEQLLEHHGRLQGRHLGHAVSGTDQKLRLHRMDRRLLGLWPLLARRSGRRQGRSAPNSPKSPRHLLTVTKSGGGNGTVKVKRRRHQLRRHLLDDGIGLLPGRGGRTDRHPGQRLRLRRLVGSRLLRHRHLHGDDVRSESRHGRIQIAR